MHTQIRNIERKYNVNVMLPDFPKLKKKIDKIFIQIVEENKKNDPFLSQFPVFRVHEGDILKTKSVNGYEDKSSFKVIQSGFSISDEDLIREGPTIALEKAEEVAKEMMVKQSKAWFNKFDEITERTGNIVNGQGAPLSPDMILSALEKVQFDFDEMGQPKMPTLFISPEMYEKIKNKIPEWESDSENRRKYVELIEKKRREWIDRENRRKLVE